MPPFLNLPVDTHVLWAFTLLWIAIVPTPGANALLIMHLALTRSAGQVALGLAGSLAGIMILATAAILGWAAALEAFPWLAILVNLLGGAYLVYLGARLLERSLKPITATAAPKAAIEVAGRQTFLTGLLTSLSNSQAIFFITSIFAATGILQSNLPTGLAAIAIMISCNATYLSFLGWVFRTPAARTWYARHRRILEGAIGIVFLGFGARLILKSLPS